MKTAVATAIEEIRESLGGFTVQTEDEAQGGAYVTIYNTTIGDQYCPNVSWIGFLIGFQYPFGDVYPHFIDGAVVRKDGRPLGDGFSGPTTWQGRSVIQISRKSNHWNPALDTAIGKYFKVLSWIQSR